MSLFKTKRTYSHLTIRQEILDTLAAHKYGHVLATVGCAKVLDVIVNTREYHNSCIDGRMVYTENYIFHWTVDQECDNVLHVVPRDPPLSDRDSPIDFGFY